VRGVAGVLQGTADVRGRSFYLVDEVSGRTVQVWVREHAVPLMRRMLGVRVLVVGRMDGAGRAVFAEDVRPCPIPTPNHTCTSEDEAMKVTVDHNLGCIALSFSRYTRRGNTWKSSWHEKDKEQAFEWFMADIAASKEPVQYFVAGSDNKTRKSLVNGRELLATSLTPADILYIARQRGVNMPAMVVEKAMPGQRGLLVRTNITK
jgi:hypothetical protein